jgi:hypothetical protein
VLDGQVWTEVVPVEAAGVWVLVVAASVLTTEIGKVAPGVNPLGAVTV